MFSSDSKTTLRWFFVQAILPMAVLTAPFFIPVFMGASMACVSMQVRDMCVDRLKLGRRLASVLVPTLVVLTFLVLIAFVILSLSTAIQSLRSQVDLSDIPETVKRVQNSAVVERVRSTLRTLGISDMGAMTGDFAKQLLGRVTDPLKILVVRLPEFFVVLFVFVLSFLGIYMNEHRVKTFILEQKIVPQKYSKVLLHSFSEYSYSAFAAAGVTAIAQGLVIGLGALFSGAPSAFIFGVIGALSSLLPYVGTFPVSIVIGVILYAQDASSAQYITLVVFAVVAGLIDNILRPVIVKSRSDLHPWVAFISIFGGLVFWGLAGVFIGPVLAGMSLDLTKAIVDEV
jgi:predicted PurR-regulated permease PerM